MKPALKAAIDAIRNGRIIVMVDDENRENEGDLVMAAQYATPQTINFMAREGRGLICLSLEDAQIKRLGLQPMVHQNQDPRKTAFTVSIEAATGVTTGISAADRAHTILVAANPAATSDDIISPGHMFPLRAHPEGVLKRNGHTEGAVDIARLAGLEPAGVICEIMADDGSMMRLPELKRYAAKHNLPLISIADLQEWCQEHGRNPVSEEQTTNPTAPIAGEVVAASALPSIFGGHDLKIKAFRAADGVEHVALIKGDPTKGVPLVRLHSECVTGDALGSLRCDCGAQLREALERISASESGVLLYVRGHEGRGIGLANKIRAYELQDQGLDTVEANEALGLPADARDWSSAADFLKQLGVSSLRLLTNNPDKETHLIQYGFDVQSREQLEIEANPFNRAYLSTKRTRMGHFLQEQSS
ncbi:3,4-dihydroxy-2-butanone-4-phosphate synthase [Swingsia samuiensis]|uniref:Multifunctional fusion protein n=1 Tax=Swingsia samuiensis TaxID=1293412 RepID=A0A4Y6UH25_9PROT|nr:3,4-dihydroxy-2-butanone-4-phosphate synthase [Swingsia samuiensis]QDH16863.1 3,4-dihydroxy-2-butanone-4-phosphate synthase [Swingsia samuiensis]